MPSNQSSLLPFARLICSNLISCSRAFNRSTAIDEFRLSSFGTWSRDVVACSRGGNKLSGELEESDRAGGTGGGGGGG